MKSGDTVEITTEKGVFTGLVLESPDAAFISLKLDSGYNIGLKTDSILGSRLLKTPIVPAVKAKPLSVDSTLPVLSILHTGGTIASKVDYQTGAVSSQFTPEEILSMFPDLKSMATIRSRLMKNMWSQDMRFDHYNLMAKEIVKEIKAGSQGIIITHGTDTLHYTAAALAFMFTSLPVPVILVGAQRSSDRGSTDAEHNLLNAAYCMTQSDFAGVALCMHATSSDTEGWLLSPVKTRKMHTSRRDAFRPINSMPFATVSFKTNALTFHGEYRRRNKEAVAYLPFDPTIKVGVLFQRTHMFADEFSFYNNYHGLVIESTGLGNLPIINNDEFGTENDKIRKALSHLIQRNVVVVLSPQTIYGRLHQHVYENAVEQNRMGILGHLSDMTTETTFLKLSWLLSNFPIEEAKTLLMQNLRGELSTRIEQRSFP